MTDSKRSAVPELLRLAAAPTPDGELLGRFVRVGDEAAFAALVERHGPTVLGVCRRVLGDRHAAEDAFQGVFLALVKNAGRVRDPGAVAAWLYGAAVRIALKARNSAARTGALERRGPNRPAADPLAEITARELIGAIDEELARLPEPYRAAVVLCCLEDRSQDEAARQLGVSPGSLKGRLERGRERLRGQLARRGIVLSVGLMGVLLGGARAAVPRHLFARASTLTALAPVSPAIGRLAAGALPSGSAWKLAAVALVALAAGALAAVGHGRRAPADPPVQAPPPRLSAPGAVAGPADRFGDPLPAGTVLRLGTTRLRQPRAWALAFEPGGTLVSFGGDYVVRAWDPATGRMLRSREFEKDRVERRRGGWLSRDAGRLAVQHDDRVKVFDVASGRELASVALTNVLDAVARFSPDGKQLAVVDEAGVVRVCDVGANTTRELAKVGGSSSLELAFSRAGNRLALANFSAGAVVWDLIADRELLRFKPADLAPITVDFDATGEVLAVLRANPKQSFHFVEVSTGRAPEKWAIPPVGDLSWAQFAPDGSTLLLGGRDGVSWFDPKTGKTIRTAAGTATMRPAYSTDGRLLASAGGWNTLQVWDARTGRSAVPGPLGAAPSGEVHGVAFSPDGKWLLTKDADAATIRVWDHSGAQKGVVRSNRWGGRYPAFSPDGKHLYGAAPEALALVRWDLPDGTESARYTFAEPAADQVAVLNSALSADGLRLAAVTQTVARGPGRTGESVTLTVWDTATGRRVAVRQIDRASFIGYGAFTPDLRWYAFGDRALSLTGGPELRLELSVGWSARQTAVSPDGRWVAQAVDAQGQKQVGGRPWYSLESRGVVIQEFATGKRVLALPTGFCGPLAFTPDGRGLVVTGPDGITRWDLATQKPVVRHPAPGRFVGSYGNSFASSLAVAPDGTGAMTGHVDTTALVWDLAAPARRTSALTEREMLAAWDELAGSDAGKAYAAARALADTGEVVAFLRARLRPVTPPPEDRVRKLVAQLGAEEFAEREAAERELRDLGDTAAPALGAAIKDGLSAEQARRAGALLTTASAPALRPGDRLRAVRAVGVLEWVATKDARDLLKRLAGGAEGARLTREAKEAITRGRERSR